MAEAREFFAPPLAEQLAKIDAVHAELQAEGMTMDDIGDIKETLIRYYVP